MADFADLKKATDINPNVWYHLTEENVDDYDGDFKSMLQTFKEDSGDDGFRVFGVGNRKTYWQFQPIGKTPGRYSLRCSETTTRKQFAVCYRDFESVENRRTRACLSDSDGTESQQWDVSLWGTNKTETYLFTNVANGTKYHLDVIPGAAVFMSPNLEGYQKRQRWLMTSVSNVDDDAYSTVFTNPPPESTRDSGTTTDSTGEAATGSASSSSSDSSSSSLSGGAIAGIVIGAILGVLAMALLGFFLWRRKKRNSGLHAKPDEAMGSHSAPMEDHSQFAGYKPPNSTSPAPPLYELPSTQNPVELQAAEQRHELR
ncbi:uncharacterized protein FIESC28_05302 [Fusarium coffeatum]|uniref:Ricin B lectin domain-containing protein n=1 Tax=Fusarium coffeatum TaxID=231269 RepID=A0A366RUQ0_9HYPO|nr:uncharacterized protein FIESC28_05302 [Fusarium coffeatum]RBR20338.1 hypothetical protein FIESC28_05302 [Fusarium coffeatum]